MGPFPPVGQKSGSKKCQIKSESSKQKRTKIPAWIIPACGLKPDLWKDYFSLLWFSSIWIQDTYNIRYQTRAQNFVIYKCIWECLGLFGVVFFFFFFHKNNGFSENPWPKKCKNSNSRENSGYNTAHLYQCSYKSVTVYYSVYMLLCLYIAIPRSYCNYIRGFMYYGSYLSFIRNFTLVVTQM